MYQSLALAALSLSAGAYAQQAGTLTTETHPPLPWESCTEKGCTKESGVVTLDANWRWVHSTSDSTNCYTGQTWDSTLCPNPTECAKNCALDGADYEGTYGIKSSGDSLDLTLVTGSNVGSRVYLMKSGGENYEMFHLKNKEFTFDVDVSNLPCGLNGALYFVEMDEDGGMSEYANNKAGAKYGTGYCDSQCPQDIKFINGLANIDDWTPSAGDKNSGTGSHGSCCNEMDVWEANSISAALTPHSCSLPGQTMCTGDKECGVGTADRNAGTCDKSGCDFNSFRNGNDTFYGPGKTVNTKSKFTVVTQFITADNTDTGALSAIRRIYVQDGKVIANSKTDVKGITATNQIDAEYCTQQPAAFGAPDSFKQHGGFSAMGDAFDRGMVLVLSIWDDYAAEMRWLDAPYPAGEKSGKPGVERGTCSATSGDPATVESQTPGASVNFSNIKFGSIGSTYKH